MCRIDGFPLEVVTDDVQLETDQTVSIGLIINELLTNTIKYAFPARSSGKIEVQILDRGDMLVMNYKDNGIGVSEEHLDFNESPMGFRLIRALGSQLHGNIELGNGEQGMRFQMIFPKELE